MGEYRMPWCGDVMMAEGGGGEWHQCSFRQPDGLSNHDISMMRPSERGGKRQQRLCLLIASNKNSLSGLWWLERWLNNSLLRASRLILSAPVWCDWTSILKLACANTLVIGDVFLDVTGLTVDTVFTHFLFSFVNTVTQLKTQAHPLFLC